jgi:malate dehydrogenase (oxaloacetate-decarboxylating)
VDEIVNIVYKISPVFGGINLEDIRSPECFIIEKKLKKLLDIPVFHDDQHGTAIVVLAGLINSLKIIGKRFEDVEVVINGAGAAGISIARLLNLVNIKNIVLCDSKGAIYEGRKIGMNKEKELIAKQTNKNFETGELKEVIKGKDVFIGVSTGNVLDENMIRSMNKNPVVFAMANPIPEIYPDIAKKAGAKIIGTGRSDFPNQINNVLAFPGIFRGALDVRARDVCDEMKIAAAYAIAEIVSDEKLNEDYIIPKPFDKRVGHAVAAAVAQAAIKSGVARVNIKYAEEFKNAELIILNS